MTLCLQPRGPLTRKDHFGRAGRKRLHHVDSYVKYDYVG